MGSILATYVCEVKAYFVFFPIVAIYVCIMAMAAYCMHRDIDENEFATGKD